MEIEIKLFKQYGVRAFIGGCIKRGEGSKFHAKAHTHKKDDSHYGWICFRSNKWLHCEALLIHELAHYLAPGGHVDAWRKKVLELGGTLDEVKDVLKSYQKQTRINH